MSNNCKHCGAEKGFTLHDDDTVITIRYSHQGPYSDIPVYRLTIMDENDSIVSADFFKKELQAFQLKLNKFINSLDTAGENKQFKD